MNLRLTFAILCAGASAAAAQQLTTSEVARVDSVFATVNTTATPGCALGISREGRLVYARGYGMANLETATAITPASIFHVASISKQFAAFSVALLAEEGKLSLDDQVQKYIPEIPPYPQPITIRNLIHHTSGLRDQWSLLAMADWRGDDLITEDDVLSIVSRQKELNFKPGDEYVYSNTGYTLLGIIVKRVSGKSLRQFADERIFQPLGMTNTHFHDDHTMVVPGRTSAYNPRQGGGWMVSIPVFDTYGATSLFTTVGDLLKWEQNFAEAKVGSRALIEKAQQPTTFNDGRPHNYGYGLSIENYRGMRLVGHSGADAGYRADVIRFPDAGLAVDVLCNAGNSGPGGLSRKVADILLEKQLKPVVARDTSRIIVTGEQVTRLEGLYRRRGIDEAYDFTAKDGKITLMPFNIAIRPVSADSFAAEGGQIRVLTEGPAGQATGLKVYVGNDPVREFDRVPRFTPTAAELDGFAGAYYSEELDVRYVVARKDSLLTVALRRRGKLDMRPTFPDAFSVGGLGTVRFIREKGKITSFRVTQGRVRNVLFRKES
ncbi:MAG TPA: serine hydrolase domain-containing protein [Gemmatimonadales bacterium]|nr:serine hydrolase domain-containing protein [Gemmatimonadales bacterium]